MKLNRLPVFVVFLLVIMMATTAQAQQASGFAESWNTVSEEGCYASAQRVCPRLAPGQARLVSLDADIRGLE